MSLHRQDVVLERTFVAYIHKDTTIGSAAMARDQVPGPQYASPRFFAFALESLHGFLDGLGTSGEEEMAR